MRVAYFVQSHRAPAQALRLLATLRRGSPNAVLVTGHCPHAEPLDETALARLGAHHFRHRRQARRGFWSLLEPYFDAVELLAARREPYDWLVYLSGQDYPLLPPGAIEAALAASPFDGYLTWRSAAAPFPEGRRRQGHLRYHYRYRELPRWAPLLRALRPLNRVQPLWQVHLTYGPCLGMRAGRRGDAARPVFVGSQWTTLRRACCEQLLAEVRGHGPVAAALEHTICPDEALAQTVLVNDPSRRLCNDNLRFVDMARARDGHPRTLGVADLDRLLASGCHFGRKFDPAVDAAVLDRLDECLAAAAPPVAVGRTAES